MNMNKTKITIIGNGQIGQAIFYLLKQRNKNYIIDVYDKKDALNKNLKDCLNETNFIFLCIPSWCLRNALKEITAEKINNKTILISISKGINTETKESVNEMLEKYTKGFKYGMLSGPMFAKEILKDKMSFAILASKDKKVYEKISELFKDTKLKVEYSKKVDSVAYSGVLKNIYTLAISIIDSSLEDNNIKGYLSAKAVSEMQEIMKILKLDSKIILGTAGLGDFIATVSSEHSQNRKVGTDISTKGYTDLKSEGLVSLPPLIKIIGKKYKKFPMLCLLEKILIERKNSKIEIAKFLKRI